MSYSQTGPAHKIALLHANNLGQKVESDFETLLAQQNDLSHFSCSKFDVNTLFASGVQGATALLKTFDAVVLCGMSLTEANDIDTPLNMVKNSMWSALESLKLHTLVKHFQGLAPNKNLYVVSDSFGGICKADGSFYSDNIFGRGAQDTIRYGELEIERTARIAYEICQKQHLYQLTLLDKADKLETSRLWRKITADINEDYPYLSLFTKSVERGIQELVSSHIFDMQDHETRSNPSVALSHVLLTSNMFCSTISTVAENLFGCSPVSTYVGDTNYAFYVCPDSDAASATIKDMLSFSFGL